MNLESACSCTNLSNAAIWSCGFSAPLMLSIRRSSSEPTVTVKFGQGCCANKGAGTIHRVTRMKAQKRWYMETSPLGRNLGFGSPPQSRHEPWDGLPIGLILRAILVQQGTLFKPCEDLIQQDVQNSQQKNRQGAGQERRAQEHEHVEQVARVTHATVYACAHDAPQAMLGVNLRQARQAPAAERAARLDFQPGAEEKQNSTHRPGQRIALQAPCEKPVAREKEAHCKSQPNRQCHPQRATAHSSPVMDGGVKQAPEEGNPDKQDETRESQQIDDP